jgi:hypothetical protein
MYHVIAIGITALLLYLISYILSQIGYISLQLHKKIWNSILGVIFMITALAGIFLALQANYKWNIPVIKTILKIHVEFGTGMAVTGFIHFFGHLPYFGNIFKGAEKKNKTIRKGNKLTYRQISNNLFVIGFVSTSVQLLLIREMMNIAGGYELIAGIFLCSWLIISAFGSALAVKSDFNDIRVINLVFTLSPIISVLLMLLFTRLMLNTGQTPSFLLSIAFTLIILLPFCFISGFTFIKLVSIANTDTEFTPGKSFSIETTGGIVSGILISILASGLLNTYQLLIVIFIIANTYLITSWYLKSMAKKTFALVIGLLLIVLTISFNPDIFFRQLLLPGIKITNTEDTSYGNITSGIYKGERSKFYNQRLISYRNDVIEREENIHYALLQCASTNRVMLISGSQESYIPELLKYNVKEMILAERDGLLLNQNISADLRQTPGLTLIDEDPIRFIKKYTNKCDAVISLSAPPSTVLLNRFFTLEFFREVKLKLTADGVFMCSPGLYDNYMNDESIKLYSSIYNSLKEVFKNVLPVAGNKLYFIASDRELSTAICGLAGGKKIRNSYVCYDYLSDDLIKIKSAEITNLMNKDIKPDRLSHPVGYLYFQSFNLTKSPNEKSPALILMAVLFALPLIVIKRRNLMMYFTASALAGFEILLLIILQLIAGNMYQLTGLMLAGIMAGLAAGAGTDFRFIRSASIKIKSIILITIYLLFGLAVNSIFKIHGTISATIFLIFSSLLPSFLTGNIYRELTSGNDKIEGSSLVYTADLAGSALGLITISTICIPAFGIQTSFFLLCLLTFTGFLFGTIGNK